MNKKLFLMIGVSGSGKSSYIKKHFRPEVVVSPDELRKKFTGDVSDQSQNGKIWGMVSGLLKKNLEQYGKAVLDATNVDSGDRGTILKNFKRREVERIAVVFDTDPEEAKRRIHKDLETGKDRSDVPDDIIDKQYEKFKRGYNSIKQQFDKVIDGNKGRSEMKKEDIQKIRKIVAEEMKAILQEDALDATEEQNYKVYQDMYITPQSNWKQKKYVPMLSAKGKTYTGKLGEIHKIQTVEYDLFHHGEVVTECGGETYSIDSDDFRNGFEMVNDEEGLKTNNESAIKESKSKNDIKIDRINNDKILPGYLKNLLILSLTDMNAYKEKHRKLKVREKNYLANAITRLGINVHPNTPIYKDEYGRSYIKEEVKKLVKIKDYFGKNIKGTIERLEEAFLKETKMYPDFKLEKGDVVKFTHNMANLHVSAGDKIEIVSDEYINGMTYEYKIKNLRNKKIYPVETSLLHTAFVKNYAYMSDIDREPEDAYLDQDFEDRISGTEDYDDLYEDNSGTIKIKADVPFYQEINLYNESDVKKIDGILKNYGFKFKGKTEGKYWSWHWYYGGTEYPRGYYRLTGDIQNNYIEMEKIQL